MKFFYLFISYAIAGCSSVNTLPMPNPSTSNFPIWAVKYIDVSDGVELYEATLIAKAYFVSGISTCGYPGEPKQEKGVWHFPTYISNIDQKRDIVINAQTGDLQWNGHETPFRNIQKLEYVIH